MNEASRSADAERAARKLLTAAEVAHGPESAEVAEVLDELAVALRRSNKAADPEALEVCERALRIKERLYGAEDPRYAASLENLGMLYRRRKEYRQALPVLERCLDIRTRALGERDPAVARTLRSVAGAQHDLGNYWEALALTERAVAIEEVALDKDDPQRVQGMEDLAASRYGVGDYAGAIELYEAALGLQEHAPTPDQWSIANSCHNLGAFYEATGDHGRAIQYLTRALRLFEQLLGRNDPLVAGTLSVLGSAQENLGDFAGARASYQRAVRILETSAPRDPDLGWFRTSLSWVYLKEGDLARADAGFRKALREQELAHGPDHPDLWQTLLGLATVAGRRGQAEEARTYFERTANLVRSTSGPRHPDLGRTLGEYAAFELGAGDTLAALDHALQAADINREHLRLTARGAVERQALLYTSHLRGGLDVAVAAVSGGAGLRSGDAVRRVWDAVVRSRAVVLDEAAERARIAGATGELAGLEEKLEAARSRHANLLVAGPGGEPPERWRARTDRARADVGQAERDLAARSAAFRTAQKRPDVGWDQVVASLQPNAALISYVDHGEGVARSYAAFVLGADRTPRAVGLGPAAGIDRLIARWRKMAGVPPRGTPQDLARAEEACRAAGRDLRARIWDPVADLLAGSKTVLIVPEGQVHLLNMAALPAPAGGYLAESPCAIHYLSAERTVIATAGRDTLGAGLLAVGGAAFDRTEIPLAADSIPVALAAGPAPRPSSVPVYREALMECEMFRSHRFESLPETVREVEDVRQLWERSGESIVLTGRSAGERSVKERLPGRRVAHFATHGFFLDAVCGGTGEGAGTAERGIGGISARPAPRAKPQAAEPHFVLSGLALAGANRRAAAGPDEEDGILTADEIASLDLLGLEWAVLSACDTGVGEVQSGEGVVGLRRAFEIAGAKTLIMSLWPVEDRSTREWMSLLYEARFRRNLETAEAVRQADLGVLKSRRAQGLGTHPFYWAAFVAAGGWR